MKRKGFTLVELLAAIGILAIILVIAVPKILDTIEASKKESFINSAKLIARTAEQQKLVNRMSKKSGDTVNCEDITDLDVSDYKSCTITFDNNIAIVNIEGKGKFKNYNICQGTKDSASITIGECPLLCDSGYEYRYSVGEDFDVAACENNTAMQQINAMIDFGTMIYLPKNLNEEELNACLKNPEMQKLDWDNEYGTIGFKFRELTSRELDDCASLYSTIYDAGVGWVQDDGSIDALYSSKSEAYEDGLKLCSNEILFEDHGYHKISRILSGLMRFGSFTYDNVSEYLTIDNYAPYGYYEIKDGIDKNACVNYITNIFLYSDVESNPAMGYATAVCKNQLTSYMSSNFETLQDLYEDEGESNYNDFVSSVINDFIERSLADYNELIKYFNIYDISSTCYGDSYNGSFSEMMNESIMSGTVDYSKIKDYMTTSYIPNGEPHIKENMSSSEVNSCINSIKNSAMNNPMFEQEIEFYIEEVCDNDVEVCRQEAYDELENSVNEVSSAICNNNLEAIDVPVSLGEYLYMMMMNGFISYNDIKDYIIVEEQLSICNGDLPPLPPELGISSIESGINFAVDSGIINPEDIADIFTSKARCKVDYLSKYWQEYILVDAPIVTISFYDDGRTFSTEGIDVSNSENGSIMMYQVWNNRYDGYDINIVSDGKIYFPEDSSYLFSNEDHPSPATMVLEINFNGAVDTSRVENMGYMFCWCNSLEELDISSFDTSNVTNMGGMFIGCELASLDLSNFDTSNVVYMNDMFGGCENLTSLNLSSFDTSKVEDMEYMFCECENIEHIYVGPKWVTDNVIYSEAMFGGCYNLVGQYGFSYDDIDEDSDYGITYAYVSEYGLLTCESGLTCPRVYSLLVDLDGGYTERDMTRGYNANATVTLEEPEKEHYEFIGWEIIEGSSILSNNVLTIKSDTVIKAKWKIEEYQLTMNLDGGTCTNCATSGKYEYDELVNLGEPTKNNYLFVGWEITTAGYTYIDSGLMINANATAKAKWIAQNLTVTYDANGGTFEGGSTTNVMNIATSVTKTDGMPLITETTSSRDTLGNKKASLNDSRQYANNESYYEDITIPGASALDVTIYYSTEAGCDWVALYTPDIWPNSSNYNSSISGKLGGPGSGYSAYQNEYHTTMDGDTARIYFYSDGSVTSYGYYAVISNADAGTTWDVETDIISGTYMEPAKLNSIFNGWYDRNGNELDEDELFNNTTIALYAKYLYELTIDLNGGSISSNRSGIYYEGDTINLGTPTNGDLQFNGWVITSGTGAILSGNNLTIGESGVTVKATWLNPQLTMNLDGGTCTNCATTGSYEYDEVVNLGAPTKTNYTFIGWNITAGGITYVNDSVTMTGNTTATAQWVPTNLTLTFDSNGGVFPGGGTTNTVGYTTSATKTVTPVVIKTMSSKNSSGNRKTSITDTSQYTDNASYYDDVTIPGATSLDVTIYYATESTSYDWVALYSPTIVPTQSNYSSSISGKLGGPGSNYSSYQSVYHTTINGDTVRIYFRSDGSVESYGYYAVVKSGGTSWNVTRTASSGTYKEPTKVGYLFNGWLDSNNNPVDINNLNIASNTTLHASWFVNYLAQDWKTLSGITQSTIKSITFYDTSTVTGPNLTGLTGIDVSQAQNGKILLYQKADTTNPSMNNVYIVSNNTIVFPVNSRNLFSSIVSAETIDFNDSIDTSKVTDMSYMFMYCFGLTELDLSNFDTSNVTNMEGMFYQLGLNSIMPINGVDYNSSSNGASHLRKILGLNSLNTNNVTNMYYMFYGCLNLTELDLNGWNTSSVINMSGMFSNCLSLTKLDISNFNTSNVTNMSRMFTNTGYNSTTIALNISSFNTSNVTNMDYMFSSFGRNVTNFILDLSHFNTSKVTNMDHMFSHMGANSTTFTLNLSSFDTSSVTNMECMFYVTAEKATTFTLDVSHFDTNKVTNMRSMFTYAGERAATWNIGDLSGWDTSKVEDMDYMFCGAGWYSTTRISPNVSGWNVNNVTIHNGFNTNGATFITPPTWVH